MSEYNINAELEKALEELGESQAKADTANTFRESSKMAQSGMEEKLKRSNPRWQDQAQLDKFARTAQAWDKDHAKWSKKVSQCQDKVNELRCRIQSTAHSDDSSSQKKELPPLAITGQRPRSGLPHRSNHASVTSEQVGSVSSVSRTKFQLIESFPVLSAPLKKPLRCPNPSIVACDVTLQHHRL